MNKFRPEIIAYIAISIVAYPVSKISLIKFIHGRQIIPIELLSSADSSSSLPRHLVSRASCLQSRSSDTSPCSASSYAACASSCLWFSASSFSTLRLVIPTHMLTIAMLILPFIRCAKLFTTSRSLWTWWDKPMLKIGDSDENSASRKDREMAADCRLCGDK